MFKFYCIQISVSVFYNYTKNFTKEIDSIVKTQRNVNMEVYFVPNITCPSLYDIRSFGFYYSHSTKINTIIYTSFMPLWETAHVTN